jgi:hypothetical protein
MNGVGGDAGGAGFAGAAVVASTWLDFDWRHQVTDWPAAFVHFTIPGLTNR